MTFPSTPAQPTVGFSNYFRCAQLIENQSERHMHYYRTLLKIISIPGVGNQRLRSLLTHFEDPDDILSASFAELKAVDLIDSRTARNITEAMFDEKEIDAVLGKLDHIGGSILTVRDDIYPPWLKHIYDAPAMLYMLGNIEPVDHDSIAIVGTRNPSEYGKIVTEKLCTDLSNAGFTIVSGLARGIDTVAHRTAVRHGGRTIAVTGSGIDVVYPQENVRLSREIRTHGAILTEYPLGTKPDAGNFPRRNRIISGLSLGTIIVESDVTGGAMITASYALDQNREVFAVPGTITERRSAGTNKLIQQGRAKLVQSYDDIIEEIASKLRYGHPASVEDKPSGRPSDMNMFEQKIYESLGDNPVHIDAIANQTGLSTSDALVHLLALEFKGSVKQLAGKMFARL
jgi:DNA processing protein